MYSARILVALALAVLLLGAAGDRAGPGIDFARVTGAGGVTTARFSWLGAR